MSDKKHWHPYVAPTKEEISLAIYGSNDFIAKFPSAIQARVLLYLATQLVLAQEALRKYADHKEGCHMRYGLPEAERATAKLECTCGFSEHIPAELEEIISAQRKTPPAD